MASAVGGKSAVSFLSRVPTLPPAGTSVSALVVSALVVVVVVGGLFAELASVFRGALAEESRPAFEPRVVCGS